MYYSISVCLWTFPTGLGSRLVVEFNGIFAHNAKQALVHPDFVENVKKYAFRESTKWPTSVVVLQGSTLNIMIKWTV